MEQRTGKIKRRHPLPDAEVVQPPGAPLAFAKNQQQETHMPDKGILWKLQKYKLKIDQPLPQV